MNEKKLYSRFKLAITSIPTTLIEVRKFGGTTSKYATILLQSESFNDLSLKGRLQLLFKTLDANDYKLRREVDLTFIPLGETD